MSERKKHRAVYSIIYHQSWEQFKCLSRIELFSEEYEQTTSNEKNNFIYKAFLHNNFK